jgi:ferredoxin
VEGKEGKCRIVVRDIRVSGGLGEDCNDACPSGALRFSANGAVQVNVDLCLACLACMALCGPDRVRVVVDWTC